MAGRAGRQQDRAAGALVQGPRAGAAGARVLTAPRPASPGRPGLLRAWIGAQLLLCLAAGAALLLVDGLPGHLAAVLPYGHGTIKQVMGLVHTVLVRQQQVPPLLAGAALAGLALPLLPGRAAGIGAALVGALALLALDWGSLPLLLPLLLAVLTGAARRPLPVLSWLPGAPLLLPGQVLLALGHDRRPLRALVGLPAAVLLAIAWLGLDSYLTIGRFETQVTWWPAALTEPTATVLARAPAGVHCEYHDVDVHDDRIHVVAEATGAVLSFPRAGGPPAAYDVPSDWGEWGGVVLDAASDPVGRRTWTLDGEHRVTELPWTADGFGPPRALPTPPVPLHHAYTWWLPQRRQLVFTDVNVKGAPARQGLTVYEGPGLAQVRALPLHTADGTPVPTIREVEWVPPLDRFVMAPDLGTRLYLVDPDNGRAEPWLEIPTANGELLWVEEQGLLYQALPDRTEIHAIDPRGPAVVRRIPTQPGVRAIAVDAPRGLLLAGSVLTGQVWVQRLDDGTVLRRLGGFMPMMRELALLQPEREAILTTWGMLYRFPY